MANKNLYVGLVAVCLLVVLIVTATVGYPQAVFADADDEDDGGSAVAAAASGD
jgi:hypothetical protein